MKNNHCKTGKILEVDCVRENGKFILCDFSGGITGLFTVRFRAPADYQAGDVISYRGKELPVLTQEMQSAPAGVFKTGAVVHVDIDLACERAFVGAGGTGGGIGVETDPVYTADKPSLALLASPAFTGTPTAPTAPDGTATTQLATTEFVTSAIANADSTPSVAFAMVPDDVNRETINRISTNNGTWIADRDGFVHVAVYAGAQFDSRSVSLYINNVRRTFGYGSLVCTEPVGKGDEVKITCSALSGNWNMTCYFTPPKYIPVNRQYSTDEQLTGETWIDGKPIYRRTLVLGNSKGFDLGGAIDTLIKTYGQAVLNSTATYAFPGGNGIIGFGISINITTGTGKVVTSSAWDGALWTVTVEYTKP